MTENCSDEAKEELETPASGMGVAAAADGQAGTFDDVGEALGNLGTSKQVFLGSDESGPRRRSLARRLERRMAQQQQEEEEAPPGSKFLRRLSAAAADLGDVFGELSSSSRVSDEQVEPAPASNDNGTDNGWQRLREIFRELGSTLGDGLNTDGQSPDSDVAPSKAAQTDVKPAACEDEHPSVEPTQPAGGFMEDAGANGGWQRLRKIFRDLGTAVGEGLDAARENLTDESSTDVVGPEVFWTGERRQSLKNRLERRMAQRSETASLATLPENETSEIAEEEWPPLRSMFRRLSAPFTGATEETEEAHWTGGRRVSLTKRLEGRQRRASAPARSTDQLSQPHWELSGTAESSSHRQRSGSVIGGSADAWRASAVVAAGRSPHGIKLSMQKLWRQLGMQVDDEEGQILVECLCDTEGPWEPLPRPLPLTQVARCANALWEAEDRQPQANGTPVNPQGCLQN